MLGGSSASAIAKRFAAVSEAFIGDGPVERLERGRRALLAAIAAREPATLREVADTVGRGAPAVSRSVDSLVRAGFIERAADPDNRRRLAMRLTELGRAHLADAPAAGGALAARLQRLAPSELRAVERAIEILERLS
jgi:DNA-binding MarR family transcriptional regulator